MLFEQLGLIAPILKALKQEGYTVPTPIQSQSIPLAAISVATNTFNLPLLKLFNAFCLEDCDLFP
jgi:superfamily II DNA/RNA helicase